MRVARQFQNLLAACFAFVLPWSSLANPPTHAITLSGDLAPGHGLFSTFRHDSQVALNNHGQILFRASDGDDSGMWRKDPDGSLIPLYHANDQNPVLPTGYRLDDVSSPIYSYLNESGQTVANSCCNEKMAWFAEPAGLHLLGRQSAPPAGVSFAVTSVRALHLNDAGQVIVAFSSDFNSQESLFAGAPGSLQLIATGSFNDKAMLDNSGDIAFLGTRTGYTGIWFGPPSDPRLMATTLISAPHLSKNGHLAFAVSNGIWISNSGDTPTAGALNGDPVVGQPGRVITSASSPVVNDAGKIAFEAQGGYFAGFPGSIRPLAREGDPAPADLPGLLYRSLGNELLFINSPGQVLFHGTYTNPLNSEFGEAIWYADTDGSVHLLARQHGPLTFDGQTRTISELGYRYDLNDLGQIAFTAAFTDGSSGVFLATIPEPASAILFIPLFLLSRRRK